MSKYNKKEYLKYVKRIKEIRRDFKIDINPITFKEWKESQPVADNTIIKIKQIVNKEAYNITKGVRK